MRLDQYCSDTDDVCCLFLPLYYLTKFLRPYINAVFVIYIWIPGMDIYWGVQNLFCHEKYNREQNALNNKYQQNCTTHAEVPFFKLFEQFGEAIPQLVIALIFYTNNAHWLTESDYNIGKLTMVMSAGSIVMGVGSGCWKCYKLCTEDDD